MNNEERWFRIEATKSLNTGEIEFDAVVEIQVLAYSDTHAMKKVRSEFRYWHLKVIR